MTFENKFPKKVRDLPDGEFYAILRPVSISIPGDERSRTNPGHGYPAHTEEHWSMEVFPNREEWEAEIKNQKRHGEFKAVRVAPAKITTEIKVE